MVVAGFGYLGLLVAHEPAGLAQAIEAGIARDAQQPFARPLHVGAVVPVTQESFLCHVFRPARIAQQGGRQSIDRPIVLQHGEPKAPG